MLKDLLEKANRSLLLMFVSFWSIFLGVDYLIHEKFISKAFNNVTLSSILPVLLILFIGFLFLLKRKGTSISYRNLYLDGLNGWKILSYFFISMVAYVVTYAGFINAFETESNTSLASYIITIISQLFYLLLIIVPCIISGSFILDILATNIENKKSKLIIALSIGFAVNGILLFALAMLHQLNVVSIFGLLILICIFGYKRFLIISKEIFIEKSSVSDLNLLGLLSLFVVIIYVIINYNSSIRPIPIGFDELSLYMNTPKLIAGYNGLTQGGQAYNWGIWMSLGFILNHTVSLSTLISILPGILSCYVLYRISRTMMNANYSLLTAAIFYTIPTCIWQSSADAKVDLALVFFTLTSVLVLIEVNQKKGSRYVDSKFFNSKIAIFFEQNIWLNSVILLGILLGYSFGIKYTAIFFIIAIASGFMYQFSSSLSLAASISCLGIAFIFISKLYSFSGIEFDNDAQVTLIGYIFILLALLTAIFHFIKHKLKYIKGFLYLIVLAFSMFLSFSPWLIKNYHETKSIKIPDLLNGKPAIESKDKLLEFDLASNHYHVSTEVNNFYAQNSNGVSDSKLEDSISTYRKKFGEGTGKYEEVQRYIGYEKGLPKYLSIFHDLGIFQNVSNFPTDIGFFLLILFPLLFLSSKKSQLASNLFNISLLILILLISFATIYLNNGNIANADFKENIEKIKTLNPSYSHFLMSIYLILVGVLNTAILLFKPMLLDLYKTSTLSSFIYLISIIVATVLINFKSIQSWQKSTKLLFLVGGSSFIIWWFFGSGITWYALPAFALVIPVLLSSMLEKEGGMLNDKYVRIPLYCVFTIGLVMMLLFRQESMMVTYSFDPKSPANSKINKLFLEYSHGGHTEEECLEIINKTIYNTAQALNNTNGEKIIRIGTSMNYFINDNDKRVYEDNQLDLFNSIYQRWYGTKDIISDNLVKSNIRYILFDFATGGMDNTPDKSLTKKVENFYDYISNNPRIEVINTDRLLEDPSSKEYLTENGRQVPFKYGIFNGTRVIQSGSLVLLKIN